jgi:hypothetical protein
MKSRKKQAEQTTNAAIAGNAVLPAALSDDEKKWFNIFEKYCKQTERRYVITWHMRIDLGISTQKINYHLSKLAVKGWLKKDAYHACTKFFYASDFAR